MSGNEKVHFAQHWASREHDMMPLYINLTPLEKRKNKTDRHGLRAEEVGSDHVYVNNCMMSRIANSVPWRRIRKVCRGLRKLAYRTVCSATTFEGKGGDAASKTLASKYEAVLQKIGLECIEFSVRLRKIRYGSGFTTHILAILL